MARPTHSSRCTSPAPRTHSSPAKKRLSTPKAALTGSRHAKKQLLNAEPSWPIRRKSATQPPQPRLSKPPLAETTTPNQRNRLKRLRNSREKTKPATKHLRSLPRCFYAAILYQQSLATVFFDVRALYPHATAKTSLTLRLMRLPVHCLDQFSQSQKRQAAS